MIAKTAEKYGVRMETDGNGWERRAGLGMRGVCSVKIRKNPFKSAVARPKDN